MSKPVKEMIIADYRRRFDDLEGALVHYRSLISSPGRLLMFERLGHVWPGSWADALFRTAELAWSRGLVPEAREAAEAYMELRGDAVALSEELSLIEEILGEAEPEELSMFSMPVSSRRVGSVGERNRAL